MKRSFLIQLPFLLFSVFIIGQENNTSFYENAAGISGSTNSAFGYKSGAINANKGSVFVGAFSGGGNSEGSSNVFVGFESGAKGYEGSENVLLGYQSGYHNIARGNTFLGYQTGFENQKGNGNVYIGYQAGYGKERSSTLYIENSNSSKPLIWGDFNKDIVNVNGSLGIGTESPAESLHIMGNIRGNALGGALRIKTSSGYIDVGAQNGSWAHIYTDRAKFIFNKDAYTITGGFSSYSSSDLSLKTNGTQRLTINNETGNVGIGTIAPDEKLTIKGKIHTEEVKVDLSVSGPDYVFEKYFNGKSKLNPSYKMLTLQEIESYAKANNHLPNVPSSREMQEDGIHLKEMNLKLLQKIEELTLYAIEQQKELDLQKENNNTLESRLEKIEAFIKGLKN
ncbi:hypothetical protein [Olleya sp. HaHaR_3_96]|uniref:hypothetical protein n=1 Tax=Olleya sp. HaHaR_3_96 TaxID=2745560 RepID=UPI001C4EAE99|nr:hypothetical protein [Olleya sp. HaHaR_3_96]QXP58410.1 hypothetical protein H0I26_10810 [Olleya sp. HaHaR_3_96]